MKQTIVMLTVAVLLAFAGTAIADWDPEQPAKWVQLPDLSTTGIDVNATEEYILADDFLCNETGRITAIHIWGSWYQDENSPNTFFTLSIHEDIPASQSPTGYSMPGDVLWVRTFQPGEYAERIYAEDINEGWMNPPEWYIFPGDHICWQYNFHIDSAEAFEQQGTPDEPVVYWLDVQAAPMYTGLYFGWKTSLDHWNDDAVWGQGMEPYLGPWDELIYPPGHEMQGESIDLAFVIATEPHAGADWGDAPDPTYPTLGASFGANHTIVPGVMMGASIDSEPDGQPDFFATGDDNDGSDDEDGVVFVTPLMPGMPATVEVTTSCGGFIDEWIDFDGDGTWAGLNEQIAAGVWVAGSSIFPIAFNVPATAGPGPTFARFRFNTAGPISYAGPAPDGEVEDYRVQIEDGLEYKWIQWPDLSTTGIDVHVMEPLILADDYLCEMPGWVNEITIWGSWLNDYMPEGAYPGLVDFILSFHADIPESISGLGYSTPGEVLWCEYFPIGSFDVEQWWPGIEEGWLEPYDGLYTFPADWTCWRYYFHLPVEESFHQLGTPDNPIVYWLDVQAIPHDPDAFFGWKTSLDHWNDDAVWGEGWEPYIGPWYELRYPQGHPYWPESIDLAFTLRHEIDTDVDEAPAPPEFGLKQNAPNPFNPTTTIRFSIPEAGNVRLTIHDMNGRVVRSLVSGERNAGEFPVVWDGKDDSGRDVGSGLYFAHLRADDLTATQKMVLIR